nr:TRAF-interacting protein with FHA domain-containing protein A isoform X1 [Equus asinus]XP_044623312.1 TRAF-interacting protein with FHA domain-containing protein A isoform X1 [Equus asinus]XP_044623313.1 TRAF-interacting protein with FHA domain-containing protein A isoform X1 [Equus asinus]XP_044623314.1 TRAF-interacting protein with FHA domain-containing protein A isoform X1 [Equus asinus]XP_044623315.1 TRAF-interacting protein with FHA domain-containing protein A isoform X1 [Equus asinus]
MTRALHLACLLVSHALSGTASCLRRLGRRCHCAASHGPGARRAVPGRASGAWAQRPAEETGGRSPAGAQSPAVRAPGRRAWQRGEDTARIGPRNPARRVPIAPTRVPVAAAGPGAPAESVRTWGACGGHPPRGSASSPPLATCKAVLGSSRTRGPSFQIERSDFPNPLEAGIHADPHGGCLQPPSSWALRA